MVVNSYLKELHCRCYKLPTSPLLILEYFHVLHLECSSKWSQMCVFFSNPPEKHLILAGKNCVLLNSVQQEWLFGCFWPFSKCLHNELSSIRSIINYPEYRCLKNVIYQIDRKNEWLLPSRFKDSSDFQNSPPFERSAYFHVTISGDFKLFQYFDFEIDFLKNKNLFQKIGLPFFGW